MYFTSRDLSVDHLRLKMLPACGLRPELLAEEMDSDEPLVTESALESAMLLRDHHESWEAARPTPVEVGGRLAWSSASARLAQPSAIARSTAAARARWDAQQKAASSSMKTSDDLFREAPQR